MDSRGYTTTNWRLSAHQSGLQKSYSFPCEGNVIAPSLIAIAHAMPLWDLLHVGALDMQTPRQCCSYALDGASRIFFLFFLTMRYRAHDSTLDLRNLTMMRVGM
jgi:hypothetical protein